MTAAATPANSLLGKAPSLPYPAQFVTPGRHGTETGEADGDERGRHGVR